MRMSNSERRAKTVTIRYDSVADTAYICLVPTIAPGAAVITSPWDPGEIGAMVNVDSDAGGRILGIGILDASARLPWDLLEEAGDWEQS
jgi:uncharacterized protein YuzE